MSLCLSGIFTVENEEKAKLRHCNSDYFIVFALLHTVTNKCVPKICPPTPPPAIPSPLSGSYPFTIEGDRAWERG